MKRNTIVLIILLILLWLLFRRRTVTATTDVVLGPVTIGGTTIPVGVGYGDDNRLCAQLEDGSIRCESNGGGL